MASNKERQKLFALYISQGIPDKEAAIKAGYSEKTIDNNLSDIKKRMFKKMDIKQIVINELEKGNTEVLKNNKILQPKDLLEWWSNIITDENIKLDYRLKVSEYLAKCHGMFIQKVEVKQVNYSDLLNQARQRLEQRNTINITPQDNE